MKKIISLLVAVVISATAVVAPIEAVAAEYKDGITVYNPVFASAVGISQHNTVSASPTATSKPSSFNGDTYYTAGKSLYLPMRNAIRDRKSSYTLNYLSDTYIPTSNLIDVIQDSFNASCSDELSASSVDGDYAHWSVVKMSCIGNTSHKSKGKYYYSLPLYFDYGSTAAEEKKTDDAISKFVKSVDTKKLTDYQIMKKVHDYICARTTYDYDALEFMNSSNVSDYYYAFSAYGALVRGKCVCQGYALAFYRICKELGYNCRFACSDPYEGCHAWNLVQLDGKYYFVDCTWDDAKDDNKTYDYFLVDYDDLRAGDSDNNEHTLDPTYYDNKYFDTKYRTKFATDSYDKNKAGLSGAAVSFAKNVFTYSGSNITPSVTVKYGDKVLKNGTDYTVSYPAAKNTGDYTVSVSGKGAYAGSYVRRVFYIIPKKSSKPSVKSGGQSSSSLTLKWDSTSGSPTGYELQEYTNSSWKTIKTVSSPTATLKSLKASSEHKYRVVAYKTVNRTKYYGTASSALTTATNPKSVKLSSLKGGKKSVTAKWKKTASSGYQIQYSTDKNMKKAKTIKASSSSTSKKIGSLKKGKKYYVRVRAYKTIKADGKKYTYYSSWSNKKSAKAK